MKFEKEFKEIFSSYFGDNLIYYKPCKDMWKLAIEYMESRKCEDCKLYEPCTNFCDHAEVCIHTEKDFCCKYWEKK